MPKVVWYRNPIQWLTTTQFGTFILLMFCLCLLVIVPLALNLYHATGALLVIKMLQPFMIAGVVLSIQLGSPLNWWRPFFGTYMEANQDKLSDREQAGEDSETIQKEIEAWVSKCTKGRWVKINSYRYKFLRKGDAMMFKLAWG